MGSLVAWWLLLQVLSIVALPITLALLRHLPDRGYPFARVLGILLPAFLAWFLGMWQLASYGQGLLIFCLVIVAGLSGLLLWKDRSILRFVREHWRLILVYEGIFATALFCGAVLRIYGPWGGIAVAHTEQPMDFAFLNGIMQSRMLPPQDPWLSGYSINYYYLGYFQAGSLGLLSGLPSEVVFNLNLATLFALTATGCFSLGYNLTRAADPEARRRAALVGTLAALFALLVGNQLGALQLITGSNQIAPLYAGEVGTVLGARLRGQAGPVQLGHTVYTSGDFGGQFDTVAPSGQGQVGDFDWWWPSRVLWDERPSWEGVNQIQASSNRWAILFNWKSLVTPDQVHRSYSITEFPFFSFYLGDMHPHVMALPLTLLAMALAMNVVLAAERGRAALGSGRWSWLFLVLNALVLGGLYMANSWDFPTYLLLYGGAWVWRWRQGVAARWNRKDSWAIVRDLGLVVLLSIVLYLPFYLTFHSLVGSKPIPTEVQGIPVLGTLAGLPVISKVLQTIGPVLWDKSSLYSFLVLFGLFLYPALTWLVAQVVGKHIRPGLWGWIGIGACVAVAIVGSFPLLLLLIPIVLGYVLLKSARPAEAIVLLMLMLALLLVLGCELVYLRDIFENRMNTVFKFYYQAWMLLAIVGAWGAGQILGGRFRHGERVRRLALRAVWAVPLLLLVAGGLVYPTLALRMAFREQRAWTLDALTNMQQYQPGDYAGVQWLRENAAPDAVVLEAVGPEWYATSGRISSATGRPTLLGWDGHELQWRGGQPEAYNEISIRRDAATTIYTTPSVAQARELLTEYGVDYVFIGSQEADYAPVVLAKFAQLGTLVFEAEGVQIYQIPPAR
jgi:YYY domain-containing protein